MRPLGPIVFASVLICVAALILGFMGGRSIGYDDRYDEGRDNGYAEGYDNGYLVGRDIGWDAGYVAGYSIGHDEGYDSGYEAARFRSIFESENYLIPERVIAWDYSRVNLSNAYTELASDYWDLAITLREFLLSRGFYRQQLIELDNALQIIRADAGPEWNASFNKFKESITWDIRKFDNYTMYVQTDETTLYDLSISCYNNSRAAQTEAWDLMPP